MRVLIVDDHAGSRRFLRAVLEAEQMEVFDAADGVEALAVLARHEVDAVVSDLLMPRLDGFRLCHAVRSNPRFATIPVVIYTATCTSAEDEQQARDMGAVHFLQKPAPATILARAVREAARCRPSPAPHEPVPLEPVRLHPYSEHLIEKLEERNVELERQCAELREANRALERRVRERTAELATTNRQLDRFAAFASHELRAPLRTMAGLTRRLEAEFAERMPSAARDLGASIAADAGRMTELLDELARFCRLGRQPVRRGHVDPAGIARQAWSDLRAEWESRDVEIDIPALPPVEADALLLRQVFVNLLANALEFTRDRRPARIVVGSHMPAEGVVYFVADNGRGFDMRHADQIFHPFERLAPADESIGSGLGLALVRNIVERHGGRVWAEAAEGQGATFFFTLTETAGGRPAPAIRPSDESDVPAP